MVTPKTVLVAPTDSPVTSQRTSISIQPRSGIPGSACVLATEILRGWFLTGTLSPPVALGLVRLDCTVLSGGGQSINHTKHLLRGRPASLPRCPEDERELRLAVSTPRLPARLG